MTRSKDIAVILHGILRTPLEMWPLAMHLKAQGYQPLVIGYPSRRHNLEDLTAIVADKIARNKHYHPDGTLYFVTHSMGGLIARYYIARHAPPRLGRLVMLAPPNTGSEVADYLDARRLTRAAYRWAFGPAGKQLLTDYVHGAGSVNYPLGIIAGDRSINPLAFLAMRNPHDGIVPVARTRIDGMADHIVLPVNHSFMMFDRRVMEQSAHFLREGRFQRD